MCNPIVGNIESRVISEFEWKFLKMDGCFNDGRRFPKSFFSDERSVIRDSVGVMRSGWSWFG